MCITRLEEEGWSEGDVTNIQSQTEVGKCAVGYEYQSTGPLSLEEEGWGEGDVTNIQSQTEVGKCAVGYECQSTSPLSLRRVMHITK